MFAFAPCSLRLAFFSSILLFLLTFGSSGGLHSTPCLGDSLGSEFLILLDSSQGQMQLEITESERNVFDAVVAQSSDGGSTDTTVLDELPGRFVRELKIPEPAATARFVVTTSSNVSAVTLEKGKSGNILPVDVLGAKYVLYSMFSTQSNNRSNVLLISPLSDTQDARISLLLSTQVSFSNVTYKRGDVLTAVVRNSEVFRLTVDGDLTGTTVASDEPIAVFLNGKQLISPERWSDHFHLFNHNSNPGFRVYRVIAAEANTIVRVETRGISKLLPEPGSSWEFRHAGTAVLVANNPVMVLWVDDQHVTVFPGDDHFSRFQQIAVRRPDVPAGSNVSLNVVVKKGNEHMIYMNNSPFKIDLQLPIDGSEYTLIRHFLLSDNVTVQPEYYIFDQILEDADSVPSPVLVFLEGESITPSFQYFRLPVHGTKPMSPNPPYIHELGGQTLELELSCRSLEPPENSSVKCLFGSSLFSEGEWIEVENKVLCVTPIFEELGHISVEVTLNGDHYQTETYVYPFVYETESQQAAVNFDSEHPYIFDMAADYPVRIEWDPSQLPVDSTNITVSMVLARTPEGSLWDASRAWMLSDGLPNSGRYEFIPKDRLTDIMLPASEENRIPFGITTVFFSVGSSSSRRLLRTHAVAVFAYANCSLWVPVLKVGTLAGIKNCPCTLEQAQADANFIDTTSPSTPFFHEGASRCVRSSVPTPAQAGQQCCYDQEGMLLYGPPGGGTPDVGSPTGLKISLAHMWYDVLPWYACCIYSDECDQYYQYRPSDDCSAYNPPAPSAGLGSGHIVTPDGAAFTFNAEGEFTFLWVNGSAKFFALDGRLVPKHDASVFTSLLVRYEAEKLQVDLLELAGGGKCDFQIFWNDVPIDQHVLRHFTFPSGVRLDIKESESLTASFDLGIAIEIMIGRDALPCSLAFVLQLNRHLMEQRINGGLLGDFNGDPEDDLRTPDGNVIPLNSSLADIHHHGLLWRIPSNESKFKYIPPFTYYSFEGPDFVPTFPETSAADEGLSEICGASLFCRFDGMVLGTAFAKETLDQYENFTHVMKYATKAVSCGAPPPVANGTFVGNGFILGRSLEVLCDDGFRIGNGVSRIFCSSAGAWSADAQCKPSPWSLGVVAAVVAAVFLVVVAGITGFLLVKKCAHRYQPNAAP